jgi:hypothetical protein
MTTQMTPEAQAIFDLAKAQLEQAPIAFDFRPVAFAVDCHPHDMLSEITDSLAAITGLAGGTRLSHLNEAEQQGYHGLVARLVVLQRELVAELGRRAAH